MEQFIHKKNQNEPRVVITGTGIYSCIGKNLTEVKDSLYLGKSGIGIDKDRTAAGYRSPLTGIIENPDLKGKLDRRMRIGLGQEGAYAYIATLEALENAGLTLDYLENNEVGILYGNDSTSLSIINCVDIMREKKDTTLIGSGAIFQSMNSSVTMNLSTIFKLKGINFTISGACSSSAHSIGMAYLLIKMGLQKQIICGGAQEVNVYSMASFDALSAFSMNIDDPTKASRPFDKHRDGLVPSGGAATVILEDYETAKARGANILAEVIGYGFSSNGEHISKPNVNGSIIAINNAIKMADINKNEIEYISAHATSTQLGDISEAIAINKIFGEHTPLISSTKSITGHECWMSGASEIVYSLIMMKNKFIAPNINYEEGDEHTSKLNIVESTVDKEFNCFLSNSFGFGGTNAALIVRKF